MSKDWTEHNFKFGLDIKNKPQFIEGFSEATNVIIENGDINIREGYAKVTALPHDTGIHGLFEYHDTVTPANDTMLYAVSTNLKNTAGTVLDATINATNRINFSKFTSNESVYYVDGVSAVKSLYTSINTYTDTITAFPTDAIPFIFTVIGITYALTTSTSRRMEKWKLIAGTWTFDSYISTALGAGQYYHSFCFDGTYYYAIRTDTSVYEKRSASALIANLTLTNATYRHDEDNISDYDSQTQCIFNVDLNAAYTSYLYKIHTTTGFISKMNSGYNKKSVTVANGKVFYTEKETALATETIHSITIFNGIINSVNAIVSNGSGYVVGDILGIPFGNHNATFEVLTVNSSGGVTSISLINPGTSYSSSNNVATSGGSGTGCTVNFSVGYGGAITTLSLYVIPNGSSYVIGDVLTIVSGDGNATCSVYTIDGSGAVTAVTLINPGSNYYTLTGVSTTGGAGTGCTVNVVSTSSDFSRASSIVENLLGTIISSYKNGIVTSDGSKLYYYDYNLSLQRIVDIGSNVIRLVNSDKSVSDIYTKNYSTNDNIYVTTAIESKVSRTYSSNIFTDIPITINEVDGSLFRIGGWYFAYRIMKYNSISKDYEFSQLSTPIYHIFSTATNVNLIINNSSVKSADDIIVWYARNETENYFYEIGRNNILNFIPTVLQTSLVYDESTNYTPPPVGCTQIKAYRNMMIYVKGNALYFSNYFDPINVPLTIASDTNAGLGGYYPVGRDNEPITAIYPFNGYLWAMKEHSRHLISGDPGELSTFRIDSFYDNIGAKNERCITDDGKFLYTFCDVGIYVFNENSVATLISDKIKTALTAALYAKDVKLCYHKELERVMLLIPA